MATPTEPVIDDLTTTTTTTTLSFKQHVDQYPLLNEYFTYALPWICIAIGLILSFMGCKFRKLSLFSLGSLAGFVFLSLIFDFFGITAQYETDTGPESTEKTMVGSGLLIVQIAVAVASGVVVSHKPQWAFCIISGFLGLLLAGFTWQLLIGSLLPQLGVTDFEIDDGSTETTQTVEKVTRYTYFVLVSILCAHIGSAKKFVDSILTTATSLVGAYIVIYGINLAFHIYDPNKMYCKLIEPDRLLSSATTDTQEYMESESFWILANCFFGVAVLGALFQTFGPKTKEEEEDTNRRLYNMYVGGSEYE